MLLSEVADLGHRPVDAVAQPQEHRLGLEMDVGGADLDRIEENGVDQPDQRVVDSSLGRILEGSQSISASPVSSSLENAVDR